MSLQERIGKSIAGVAVGTVTKFDAAIEMQKIASETFPLAKSPGHALAQYLETDIGKRHANDLSTVEYMSGQWNNALGNGAESVIKQQREALAKSHHDETGGSSGGQVRDDNAPRNVRTQTHSNLNPSGSEPPNADLEESYSPEKISLRFKEDVLAYIKANPRTSYDDAVGAVGSKWHALEREIKQAGASRRFASGARP